MSKKDGNSLRKFIYLACAIGGAWLVSCAVLRDAQRLAETKERQRASRQRFMDEQKRVQRIFLQYDDALRTMDSAFFKIDKLKE